jgi:hypothetical protein
MATYATTADFESYVEGWVTDDSAALERVLQRAEEDIDDVVAGSYLTTGRKLDPTATGFGAARVKYLKRATCAQAEYRIIQGEGFFSQAQFDSVSGPDFSTSGKRRYLGPKARRELQRGQLMATTGRAHP